MAKGTCAMQCYIESSKNFPSTQITRRQPLLPRFPRPLSILLATAAAFTCVRSQANPIQIKVASELTECVPSNITWRGGTPPYTLGIGIGNFNHGPDQEFSNLSTTFFVWSTNLPAPSTVQFAVGDSTGIAYSSYVDIIAGLTQSCLPTPLNPFTSSSGSSNPSTKTQGAPPSPSSSAGQPPSTVSEPAASTTVTVSVSVTGSAGGTNTATSASAGSSQSGLSPDVIGIIAAVAVVLVVVVLWILYKRSTRPTPGTGTVAYPSASTSPAPMAGPMAQYPAPPTSPIMRPTSILSASPTGTYSPVVSPGGALQLSPYGHPPPPASPWQSAASIHTTHTQYYVGPGSPAPRPPAALPGPEAWNAPWGQNMGGAGEQVQGRLEAGHAAGGGGTVVSDEGSDSWRALISPPPARWPGR